MSLFHLLGRSSSTGSRDVISTIDRNANKHHVEGDRYDRQGLVKQSSVLFSRKEVNSRFTMSDKTDSPLLAVRKHIRKPNSITEYKAAASTSTRTIGIKWLFEARNLATRLSILQTRYTSNPGHFKFQGLNIGLGGTCLPEHDKLVARVETINAMIHFSTSTAKTLSGLAVACEFP